MYRKWAAICPGFASRAAPSRFAENVFVECLNEKSAILRRFVAGIKFLFYPLCAFKNAPSERT